MPAARSSGVSGEEHAQGASGRGGQANGQIVLFDYLRAADIREREEELGPLGAPKTLPVRVPAGSAAVRIANLPVPGRWACFG